MPHYLHFWGKMKNKIFRICFFLLIFAWGLPLNARGGQLFGQKDIRVVSTEWFDIIFPAKSAESAQKLFENADRIYEEVCASFGYKMSFRLPIVLTSSVEAFNAYFSNGTYNHLVLLDTPSENASMAVFSDGLLGTFRHEITHAVTINLRNDFWLGADNVFGDVLNWSYVTMNRFMEEGAAVAEESKGGEGRLNDDFYLHTVRQAKLNETFPAWSDVLGSRDIYPAGNFSYAFGGPFTDFLQKTYGMEKYALLWWKCVNAQALTLNGAAKKVYKKPMKSLWEEFKAFVEIPSVPKNPVAAGFSLDFFEIGGNDFSYKNSVGKRFSNLTGSAKGVFAVEAASSSVWFYAYKDTASSLFAKKLFTLRNIQEISSSEDGAFLAVSYYNAKSANVKTALSVFNVQKNTWIPIEKKGLTHGSILRIKDDYFVCAVKTDVRKQSLVLYKIINGNRAEFSKEIPLFLSENATVYQVVQNGSGRFSILLSEQNKWLFRTFYIEENDSISYTTTYFPLGMKVHSLSYSNVEGNDYLAFSYVLTKSFPRCGFFDMQSQEFFLMEGDISGGVYFPVFFKDSSVWRIAYSGNFVYDSKLLFLNTEVPFVQKENETLKNKITFAPIAPQNPAEQFFVNLSQFSDKKEDSSLLKENLEDFLQNSKSYKKVYYTNGVFLPVSLVPEYDKHGNLQGEILFPGVTWITGSPWDSDFFAASAGFDFLSATGGAMLLFRGGTDAQTQVFSYQDEASVTFDAQGFKQVSNSALVSSAFPVFLHSSLLFSAENNFFLGRQFTENDINDGLSEFLENPELFSLFGLFASRDKTNYFFDSNSLVAQFSTVRQTGAGHFQKGGLTFAAVYYAEFSSVLDDMANGTFYHSLYPIVQINVPQMLPFDCVQGFTYNLPLVLRVALVPTNTALLSATGEVMAFSAEIQKGLGVFPLYLDRVVVTASYSANLSHQNQSFEIARAFADFSEISRYNDSVSAKCMIQGSVNAGFLANSSISALLGLAVDFFPHHMRQESPWQLRLCSSMLF